MSEEQRNKWITSILTLWNTFEFRNLIQEFYNANLSHRDHVLIMDEVYKRNQFAYYDTENIISNILFKK